VSVPAVAEAAALVGRPALGAGALVQLGAAFVLLRRAGAAAGEPSLPRNPFELAAVLQLAALLAVVGVLARLAAAHLGDAGIYAVAALSGLADVDAVTLTMGGLVPDDLSVPAAATAIAIAVAANTLAKAAYGLALGTRRFALAFGAGSALALVVGGAALAAATLP
jgi:uncharacterized membrane protein (DUF4010 family)